MIQMIGNGIAGYFGNMATKVETEQNNRISKANAESGNKVRTAGNAATAAKNSLSRWVQSVNNQRVLKQGGVAMETNAINTQRQNDVQLAGGFSASIREAEAMGARAAAAATSGIDGNVVDMINGSAALRDSIVGQQLQDFTDMRQYDAAKRAGNIASQMIGGLDNSLILDTLDWNQNFATTTPTVGGLAAAVRGAFPYAQDALRRGQNSDAGSSMTYQQAGFNESVKMFNDKDWAGNFQFDTGNNGMELWSSQGSDGLSAGGRNNDVLDVDNYEYDTSYQYRSF